MNVAIVGSGYVGLVSGACLAEKGHKVVCIDADASKVAAIRAGRSPFHEPGLDQLLERHAGKALTATTDLRAAVRGAELTLICVGTPFDGARIDLAQIRSAARAVGEALKGHSPYHAVVVKSTVVPGTTEEVVGPIIEEASGKKAGDDFGLGMNPEFLTEGEAVRDFMVPDRIVVGGIDDRSLAVQEELYAAFAGTPVIRTNPKTAEMIKYASNCLLSTLISFSNELGNLCAAVKGVDVADVMRGVHESRYLTLPLPDGRRVPAPITSFLWAGCGFGGSCLPKDTKALQAHGEAAGAPMRLLDAVLRINQEQPRQMIDLLKKRVPSLKGARVTVLGLSFRQDTDDMRESPSIPIVRALLAEGAIVTAYDPKAEREARRVFGEAPIRYAPSLIDSVRDARGVLLVTRWDEFKSLPDVLREHNPGAVVVDGRRVLDKSRLRAYEGIGL